MGKVIDANVIWVSAEGIVIDAENRHLHATLGHLGWLEPMHGDNDLSIAFEARQICPSAGAWESICCCFLLKAQS